VVWGGLAGAISPLIADVAIDGQLSAAGWTLFAIVFAWQPPHFWAITLYRRAEYEAAGFPLLVARIGERALSRHIFAWIVLMLPVSLLPVALGLLGPLYGLCALALGISFVQSGVVLLRDPAPEPARGVFRRSLVYLVGIFAAMLVELIGTSLW
jgi:protoheme IX farnesyltransferase